MGFYDEFDDVRFVRGMEKVVTTMNGSGSLRARGPLLGGMVIVALISVLVGVVFFSYPEEQAAEADKAAVPIIRADAGAIKVLPQDPGGMDIPYRDSTIFETFAERKGGREVENLLDDAEEPMERSQIFAGLKTDLQVSDDNQLNLKIAVPKKTAPVEEKTEAVADAVIAQAPAQEESAPVPVVSAAKPEALAAIVPAVGDAARPAAPQKVMTKGAHMVQLGSLRSEDAARQEWAILKTRFPGQLSGLDLNVQKIDLGAKGVFYRIQGGPVEEAQARAICSSMEASRPGGCFVVKR